MGKVWRIYTVTTQMTAFLLHRKIRATRAVPSTTLGKKNEMRYRKNMINIIGRKFYQERRKIRMARTHKKVPEKL